MDRLFQGHGRDKNLIGVSSREERAQEWKKALLKQPFQRILLSRATEKWVGNKTVTWQKLQQV